MAAIDVQSQEGPSARTVSAVLDAAAERLAAAGVEAPAATPKCWSPTRWA